MRLFGLACLAFLTACSARPGRLPLAEPGLELSDAPPAFSRPPTRGAHESDTSRAVRIVVAVGDRVVELWSWCRVGVWTTLQELRPERFVTRESWGRLGQRRPRMLARIHDEALGGVVARLRPERDGSLSFLVEVSAVDLGKPQPAGRFFHKTIMLGHPRRHGYRFRGRAPPDWHGPLAHWAGAVTVRLAEASETAVAPGGSFVAGKEASAETFTEEWVPARPIHTHADGVMRADFRLKRRRRASGFKPDGRGWYNTYGGTLDIRFDSGAVRFAARR